MFLKIGYGGALALISAVAIAILAYFQWSRGVMLALVCLLLIPGRIQGHYWREFFRGRRMLADNHPHEAIEYFNRFLIEIRHRPWLRKLMWLSWAFYTPSVEVMTRTNLGVAFLALGQVSDAEEELRMASQLDPRAPLPWHNLAVVHQVRGETALAEQALKQARDLGFTGGPADQLARQASELLARAEGGGKHDAPQRSDV